MEWPDAHEFPAAAVHVDDRGRLARCELAPSPGGMPAGAPELLSGIRGLLQGRGQAFGDLFAAYDADCDGVLDGPELEALARDAVGEDAGAGGARYFMVLLDGDGDGLVTAADLCGAARRLCGDGGPALVAKDGVDASDALVALAGRLGGPASWREQATGTFARFADGEGGAVMSREGLAHLLRAEFPQLTLREARHIVANPGPDLGADAEGGTRLTLSDWLAALAAHHPSGWTARLAGATATGGAPSAGAGEDADAAPRCSSGMASLEGVGREAAAAAAGDRRCGGAGHAGSAPSRLRIKTRAHAPSSPPAWGPAATHAVGSQPIAFAAAPWPSAHPPYGGCHWTGGGSTGDSGGDSSSGGGGASAGSGLLGKLCALAAAPEFRQAAARLQQSGVVRCTAARGALGDAPCSEAAAVAALLAAAAAVVERLPVSEAVSYASRVAQVALAAAATALPPESPRCLAGSSACSSGWRPDTDSGSHWGSPASCTATAALQDLGEAEAPVQELLHALETSPARLQAAFAARAAGGPQSPSFALQPRHSLLPLADLPAVLADTMPHWPAALVEYASAQLVWHVNVVSYTSDSPLAGGGGGGGRGACRPGDMMYAEMAAAIIAAAETEAAATDARLLPGAQLFVEAVAAALQLGPADGGGGSGGGGTGSGGVLMALWKARETRLGRPLHIADVASLLAESAQSSSPDAPAPQPSLLDDRQRAWLAAALVPVLGSKQAPLPAAVEAALAHLRQACAAAAALSGLLPQQAALAPAAGAAAGPASSAHQPPHSLSSAAGTPKGGHGGLGRSIALRRWRMGNTWSLGSGGDGGGSARQSLGGFPLPWHGAISRHNTDCDAEQPAAAGGGCGGGAPAPADILQLVD